MRVETLYSVHSLNYVKLSKCFKVESNPPTSSSFIASFFFFLSHIQIQIPPHFLPLCSKIQIPLFILPIPFLFSLKYYAYVWYGDRCIRITTAHCNFIEAIFCDFWKIIVDYLNSDIFTVIPNIHLIFDLMWRKLGVQLIRNRIYWVE
jgi:hypothetical protein